MSFRCAKPVNCTPPRPAVGLAEERAPGIEIRRRETRIEVVVLAHRGRTVGRRPVVHHQIEQRCVVAVLDAVNVERIDGRVLGLREFDVEDALAVVLVRRQEEFPVVAEQVVARLGNPFRSRLWPHRPQPPFLRRRSRGDQLAGLESSRRALRAIAAPRVARPWSAALVHCQSSSSRSMMSFRSSRIARTTSSREARGSEPCA